MAIIDKKRKSIIPSLKDLTSMMLTVNLFGSLPHSNLEVWPGISSGYIRFWKTDRYMVTQATSPVLSNWILGG